jgi:hypothetical protein
MALRKPKFRPGITKVDTGLQSEGSYIDGNRVRFYKGQPQPIGGWQVFNPTSFTGLARGAHAWTNLQGQRCVAFGTASHLYGFVNSAIRDITPRLHLTVLNNALSTVSGSPLVTVSLPFHNLSVGDPVVFSNHQSTVGGLTVEGTYTVTSVVTSSLFIITHASNASSTATLGGGFVDVVAALPVGLVDNPPTGYGTGSYGEGSYGSGLGFEELRVWTLDNFGENLMANPSGYGLAEWQPESNYEDLEFNGTFTGNANGWALGTGWAYASNAVTKTAGTGSNLSQSVTDILEGGRTYVVRFTVTRSAGSLKFRVNAGSPAPAVIDVAEASSAITKSGTYERVFRCPANPSDIVFEADSAFAGTVDSVSYQLYDRAYFIRTAPPRIDSIFVDPRGVVVAVGSTKVDGSYDPICVRNCAIANNRVWVPDTNNVASEIFLRGGGGRLMAGCATRQQSMVWGDDGVFSLQWQGQVGQAFTPSLLATSTGLLSRHSFAKANGFVVFVTNTKEFFIFRGIGATSLGVPEKVDLKVRDDVFDNIDFTQSLKCNGGLNPSWDEFWFFYPDSRDGNECSRYVTYNWIDDTASVGIMDRTAWIPAGVLANPLGFAPRPGVTGIIMEHEVGTTANGAPLGAWVETSFMDNDDGEQFIAIMALVPDIKSQSGNITFTVKSKLYPQATTTKTTGPFTLAPTDTRKTFRVHARQFAIRWDWVTAGGFGRLNAWSLDLAMDTARR